MKLTSEKSLLGVLSSHYFRVNVTPIPLCLMKPNHHWKHCGYAVTTYIPRYWGTPIPLWVSDDGEEVVCIGSIAELEELTGEKITDLHRESIDHLTIPSKQGKGENSL